MGAKRDAQLVDIRRHPVRVPGWALVVGWVLRGVVRLVALLVSYWRTTAPAFALVWLWLRYGLPVPVVLVLVLAAGLVGWRIGHRDSFDRFVFWPVVSRWRGWWLYGRRWEQAMKACGLAKTIDGTTTWPGLRSVKSGPAGDVLRLKILMGQTPEYYSKVSAELAYSFATRLCRVFSGRVNILPRLRPVRRGWTGLPARFAGWCERRYYATDRPTEMTLMMVRGDLLGFLVPPAPIAEVPDLEALPVGLVETGRPFLLRLLGTHLLIVGATGAGKASVIWAILRALAGGIRSGVVQVWGVDPKGGMELAMGKRLFTRLEYADPTGMVSLLEAAVQVMRDRQARLAGIVRTHEATRTDPLIVVLVDEIAGLTAYITDKQLRDRIAAALALLLSQGRALGVVVVGAVQDPRKEIVDLRNLFPTRIALRLTEPAEVNMALGGNARERGALADQIPGDLPGVGYVLLPGQAEPARVRFSWTSDRDIRDLTNLYPAPFHQEPTPAPGPALAGPTIPVQPGRNGRTPNGNGSVGGQPNGAHPVVPDSLLRKLRGDDQ
jgi:S-DNA-T family DNA segregation ATPase FtsK/SpoIIIE